MASQLNELIIENRQLRFEVERLSREIDSANCSERTIQQFDHSPTTYSHSKQSLNPLDETDCLIEDPVFSNNELSPKKRKKNRSKAAILLNHDHSVEQIKEALQGDKGQSRDLTEAKDFDASPLRKEIGYDLKFKKGLNDNIIKPDTFINSFTTLIEPFNMPFDDEGMRLEYIYTSLA